MPSVLDEHTQFVDSGGSPIVNGQAYFGVAGLDPTILANQITIYSDRGLTTPIANPQILDANGRTTAKVWVPALYSLQVDDENDVQQYQELDNGEAAGGGGNIIIGSIAGTNIITGTGSTTVTTYVNGQLYIFTTLNQIIAGGVTVDFDGAGAKDVVYPGRDSKALEAGDWKANQTVMLVYNSTNDEMVWVNQDSNPMRLRKGADIASAAALTLGFDGNYFDVTGTTTITSITAWGIGSVVRLHFDDVLTLTHNATDLVLPGAANILTTAGDEATFVEYAAGDWRCTSYEKRSGYGLFGQPLDKSLWPTVSNDADAAHDILISPGAIMDNTRTHVIDIATALTKQIDANWAAGDDAGGFPSGLTITADTTYHFFVLFNPVTFAVDAGWDSSLTATNLLADATGFTFYRRLCSFILDGSSNILAFTQIGDFFKYTTPVTDVNTTMINFTDGQVVLTVPASITTLEAVIRQGASATTQFRTTGEATTFDQFIETSFVNFVANGVWDTVVVDNANHDMHLSPAATNTDIRIDTLGFIDRRNV